MDHHQKDRDYEEGGEARLSRIKETHKQNTTTKLTVGYEGLYNIVQVDSPCDADYNPPELTANPIGASLAPFPPQGHLDHYALDVTV